MAYTFYSSYIIVQSRFGSTSDPFFRCHRFFPVINASFMPSKLVLCLIHFSIFVFSCDIQDCSIHVSFCYLNFLSLVTISHRFLVFIYIVNLLFLLLKRTSCHFESYIEISDFHSITTLYSLSQIYDFFCLYLLIALVFSVLMDTRSLFQIILSALIASV